MNRSNAHTPSGIQSNLSYDAISQIIATMQSTAAVIRRGAWEAGRLVLVDKSLSIFLEAIGTEISRTFSACEEDTQASDWVIEICVNA